MSLVAPVHTAEINGKSLRLFRSPRPGPDLPWHAFDDLMAVCDFDRGQRRYFLRTAQREWGDDLKTVATATGPVTIAPHYAAQGMIGAAVELGRVPKTTEVAYAKACVPAMNKITAGMSQVDSLQYIVEAARNVAGQ